MTRPRGWSLETTIRTPRGRAPINPLLLVVVLVPVCNVFVFSRTRVQSNALELYLTDWDMPVCDYVGRSVFDLGNMPTRVPPDSPLASPRREGRGDGGYKVREEVILAV